MRLSAAAAGPTMSVKTRRTPTIWAHSATATATMARKAVETKRKGTPRASASSGWREAKTSGRLKAPRAPPDSAAVRMASVRRAAELDAEHVAEEERRRLRRRRRVEVQEEEAEAERQRQHHADRDVALGELLAEEAHADPRRRG